MGNFFILACVLVGCVAVRGFEVQQLADVLGVTKSQFVECVDGNDLDNADFSRISQLLGSTKLETDDQKLIDKFSCFLACIFEKGKIIEDEKIQLGSVLELAEENDIPLTIEMKEYLNACIDDANTKSDVCEASLVFSVCIHDRLLRYGQ
ncbi:odorant binding protein 7 [Augochlora pura]